MCRLSKHPSVCRWKNEVKSMFRPPPAALVTALFQGDRRRMDAPIQFAGRILFLRHTAARVPSASSVSGADGPAADILGPVGEQCRIASGDPFVFGRAHDQREAQGNGTQIVGEDEGAVARGEKVGDAGCGGETRLPRIRPRFTFVATAGSVELAFLRAQQLLWLSGLITVGRLHYTGGFFSCPMNHGFAATRRESFGVLGGQCGLNLANGLCGVPRRQHDSGIRPL